MTFKQKLGEMYQESLFIQRQFLKVMEDMRKLTDKGEPVPEEMIYHRDQHYKQFNVLLKKHHRIRMYTVNNNIDLSTEFDETNVEYA
jgi:hypothetical protein